MRKSIVSLAITALTAAAFVACGEDKPKPEITYEVLSTTIETSEDSTGCIRRAVSEVKFTNIGDVPVSDYYQYVLYVDSEGRLLGGQFSVYSQVLCQGDTLTRKYQTHWVSCNSFGTTLLSIDATDRWSREYKGTYCD